MSTKQCVRDRFANYAEIKLGINGEFEIEASVSPAGATEGESVEVAADAKVEFGESRARAERIVLGVDDKHHDLASGAS